MVSGGVKAQAKKRRKMLEGRPDDDGIRLALEIAEDMIAAFDRLGGEQDG
jgi:hypothetical protein